MSKLPSTPAPTSPPDEPLSDSVIVNMRTFAASRAEVFGACSDPARLALWWGPRGFTNTFHEFDFRPGGVWRFVMRGPDGTEFANESRFLAIAAPERIVVEHERPMHRFRLTMTFAVTATDTGTGTTLTWDMRFEDPAEVARIGTFLRAANEQNFDRLQAHLHLP